MLLAGYLPTPRTPSAPSLPSPDAADPDGFYAAKRAAIADFEREYFRSLAHRCHGNVSEMARKSSMQRHHVRAFLRKHGIDRHSA